MQKGKKVNTRNSREYYRWAADMTHKFNIKRKPLRGGIRL